MRVGEESGPHVLVPIAPPAAKKKFKNAFIFLSRFVSCNRYALRGSGSIESSELMCRCQLSHQRRAQFSLTDAKEENQYSVGYQ
jgi:hypothetical protein